MPINKRRMLIITSHFTMKNFNFRTKMFAKYLRNYFHIRIYEVPPLNRCIYNVINSHKPLNYTLEDNLPVIRMCSLFPHDIGHLIFSAVPNYVILRYIDYIKKFRPEVIMFSPLHTSTALIIESLWKHGPDPFLVYEDVDRFFHFFSNPLRIMVKGIEFSIIKKANLVISVSPKLYAEDKVIRKNKPTKLLPNGVDISFFSKKSGKNKTRDNKIIVYVGTIEWWSGLEKTIETINYLKKMDSDIRLLIIGSTRSFYANKIISKAKRLGILNKNVFFLGPKPYHELPSLLSRCGFGISLFPQTPLLDNAIPLKLIEYAASGLPIVTTDITYIGKIIKKRRAGLVFKPNAEPEIIANSILEAMKNKKYYNEISLNALSTARIFDIKNLARKEAENIIELLR